MQDEVVADSTVLIFLGKLQKLHLLEQAHDRILVPPKVHEEVVERGTAIGASDAVLVESAVQDGWIEIVETDLKAEIQRFDLESGETAVLSLALQRGHDMVLADEESVREVARINGLTPQGTLYYLFVAIQRNDLSFDEFLDLLEDLLDEGFYLNESVYLEAVRKGRRLAEQ